jgi:hypothetical protein
MPWLILRSPTLHGKRNKKRIYSVALIVLYGILFAKPYKGERNMSEKKFNGSHGVAGFGGFVWFAGWLFTIAYANLVWWKIILGLVVWPYYLGLAVR